MRTGRSYVGYRRSLRRLVYFPTIHDWRLAMDYSEFMQAISSVGCPIAACCVLFYLYDKTLREVVATLQEVSKTLREVSDTLKAN